MGEPAVAVRAAQSRDVAFVMELWGKMIEELGKTDERYAIRPEAEVIWAKWLGTHIREENSCVLLAERNDEILGYLIGSLDEAQPIFQHRRHAVITDVFVLPEERRKGAGTRLVEEALSFFKSLGAPHVRVNVLVKGEAARSFWQKLAFEDFLYRMWKGL